MADLPVQAFLELVQSLLLALLQPCQGQLVLGLLRLLAFAFFALRFHSTLRIVHRALIALPLEFLLAALSTLWFPRGEELLLRVRVLDI